MTLSYFNINVYYETLKVGNLDLIINNVTLEAIPLLNVFISSSKYMKSSILNYFKEYFDDINEDNLYKYLEKAIKLIHGINVNLDNSFLYFIYLLQVPRYVLSHIKSRIRDRFDGYNPLHLYPDEINIEENIKSLWSNLKERSINIEESIKYYMLLIESTFDGEYYDRVLETLEEAAEIYLENKRYDLYFINYTNVGINYGDTLNKYLGIIEPNDPLPKFILHNYIIICGDIFIVHDPMLDLLPTKIRDKLLTDKNSTYKCNLDKDRSNDMKMFLELIYKISIGFDRNIFKREIILLLIDLQLICRFVKTMDVYINSLSISVKDFLEEDKYTKLRGYINKYYRLENKEDIDYIDDIWIIIKEFRKYDHIESIKLYQMLINLIYG